MYIVYLVFEYEQWREREREIGGCDIFYSVILLKVFIIEKIL